jgi:hypothetical protein
VYLPWLLTIRRRQHFPRVVKQLRKTFLEHEIAISQGGGLSNFDFVDADYNVAEKRRPHTSQTPKSLPQRQRNSRAAKTQYAQPHSANFLPNPGDTSAAVWVLKHIAHDISEGFEYLSQHPQLGYPHLQNLRGRQKDSLKQWLARSGEDRAELSVLPDTRLGHREAALSMRLLRRVSPSGYQIAKSRPNTTGSYRPSHRPTGVRKFHFLVQRMPKLF